MEFKIKALVEKLRKEYAVRIVTDNMREAERKHLREIQEYINKLITEEEKNVAWNPFYVKADFYGSDDDTDIRIRQNETERKKKEAREEIKRLKGIRQKPYFAKLIVLYEGDEKETACYIGQEHLADLDGKYLVSGRYTEIGQAQINRNRDNKIFNEEGGENFMIVAEYDFIIENGNLIKLIKTY